MRSMLYQYRAVIVMPTDQKELRMQENARVMSYNAMHFDCGVVTIHMQSY